MSEAVDPSVVERIRSMARRGVSMRTIVEALPEVLGMPNDNRVWRLVCLTAAFEISLETAMRSDALVPEYGMPADIIDSWEKILADAVDAKRALWDAR